jgi:hypothetical protein
VTVNIFLRELRGIWRKAAPDPSQLVIDAAHRLCIVPDKMKDKSRMLELLMGAWRAEGMKARDFPEFEAALVRYALVSRRTRQGPQIRHSSHPIEAHR